MKAKIEDYLHRIDNYFLEKSQKDVYMTYIMVFAIIFGFSYLLFWDTSEADFEAKRKQVVSIEGKIAADNRYLQQNPPSKIIAIKNDTIKANKSIVSLQESNAYIKSKIEEISSLVYDEQTWGEYLHSISKNALKHKVQIEHLNNKYADSNETFGHILDISLQTNGDYKNTLNFINSLEASELVVDLHSLNIVAKNNLNSDLNISVWGIIY